MPAVRTMSANGKLLISIASTDRAAGSTWKYSSYDATPDLIDRVDQAGKSYYKGIGFKRVRWPNGSGVVFPHWFFVMLLAMAANLPWIRRRFSLRTLLITTTLVAVALGLIVATQL